MLHGFPLVYSVDMAITGLIIAAVLYAFIAKVAKLAIKLLYAGKKIKPCKLFTYKALRSEDEGARTLNLRIDSPML